MPKPKSRNKFGNIRELDSLRFQASYAAPSGKRIYAPTTFVHKRDAEDWLATVQADMIRGLLRKPKGGKLTLRAYVEDIWFPSRKLRPKSRHHYDSILNRHILPFLGNMLLTAIDQLTVKKWHTQLGNRTGPAMQANAYRVLNTVMNTATLEDDLIPFNPCKIRRASTAKVAKDREALSISEVMDLANAVPARYRAYVLLATFGQLRHGELIGLRRCDVDLEAGTVTVRQQVQRINGETVRGEPKTEKGKRTVALPGHVVDALTEHFRRYVLSDQANAGVFSTATGSIPWHQDMRKILLNAGKKVGIESVFPHLLRHAGLTFYGEHGATNAELLARGGHSSINVAMRYQHASSERDRELADRLNERILSAVKTGPPTQTAQAEKTAQTIEIDWFSEEDGTLSEVEDWEELPLRTTKPRWHNSKETTSR